MKKSPLYAILVPIAKFLCHIIFRFKVYGRENIPPTGRVILCMNHRSMMDVAFFAFTTKRQIYYMAKSNIFGNKLGNWFFRNLGAFQIDREKTADRNAVNRGIELLEEEKLVGIFAEGTRTKDGNLQRFKSGVALFAYAGNAPVVPAAITYKSGKFKWFTKTVMSIGTPITPEDMGLRDGKPAELRKAVPLLHDAVARLVEENNARL